MLILFLCSLFFGELDFLLSFRMCMSALYSLSKINSLGIFRGKASLPMTIACIHCLCLSVDLSICLLFLAAESASVAKTQVRFSCNTWWVVSLLKKPLYSSHLTLSPLYSHKYLRHPAHLCPNTRVFNNLCPLPSHTRECVQNDQSKQLAVAPGPTHKTGCRHSVSPLT